MTGSLLRSPAQFWVVLCVVFALSTDASAAKLKKRRRHSERPPSGPIEVPIEVAAGPALLVPSPPAFGDQGLHFGLQIKMAAIVDAELIRRHSAQIPPWARNAAGNLAEVRVRPSWLALLPELLVISPQVLHTGMYGAVWRPYGVSITLVDRPALRIQAGAAVSVVALLLHSTTLGGGTSSSQSFTLVLRPGLHFNLGAELPLSKNLLLQAGWSSEVFVPQVLGRPPWEVLPVDNSLWHLGGPYVMLAWRFAWVVNP